MKTAMQQLAASVALSLLTAVSQAQGPVCNDDCLIELTKQYLRDVSAQDASKLPWADAVRYTENNVGMMIGDGFWGAGPGVSGEGLFLPDAQSGNVVWFGVTTEHGQAAYHGLRLKIVEKQIQEVESYLGREGEPEVFAKVDGHSTDRSYTQELPASDRSSREQLIAIVDGYFNSKQQNNGRVLTAFTTDCEQKTNGVSVTHGDHWAARVVQGCETQLRAGVFKPVDRIRARRYPIVNESTGVVVALSIEDHATRFVDYTTLDGKPLAVQVEYPNSRGKLDLFKIVDGKIARIEGVSVFLPYFIHSLWRD